MDPNTKQETENPAENSAEKAVKGVSRRKFIKGTAAVALTGSAAGIAGCKPAGLLGSTEAFALEFQEYFKKHYKLMSQQERLDTVKRLEKLALIKDKTQVKVSTRPAQENVLYGYAFNVTRCEGYMECVKACVK